MGAPHKTNKQKMHPAEWVQPLKMSRSLLIWEFLILWEWRTFWDLFLQLLPCSVFSLNVEKESQNFNLKITKVPHLSNFLHIFISLSCSWVCRRGGSWREKKKKGYSLEVEGGGGRELIPKRKWTPLLVSWLVCVTSYSRIIVQQPPQFIIFVVQCLNHNKSN